MPNSNPTKILAIETSCDETAAALVEVKGATTTSILSNIVASQINIHKKFGGIFPEHASRAHVEKIIPVVSEALGDIDPNIIAVTTGPGLIGSLLIGVNFAKTMSYAKKLPIIGINHLLGHLYSNWAEKPLPQFPTVILIVSGGHTGLYLMKSHGEIKLLGATLDDAAGEAFDKVAKLLGLGYPGGPAIAEAAAKFSISKSQFTKKSQIPNIKLPRSMLDRKDYNFSFSGLKTAVLYKVKELAVSRKLEAVKPALAAEFQQTVIDILVGKTIQAAYEFRPKSICLCGGVSANKKLREELKKAVAKLPWKTSYHVPPIELSTDNAAMIGLAAAYHLNDKTSWDKIHADPNLKL
jgi:N6-L-threonylcarbamoyladenine synthase